MRLIILILLFIFILTGCRTARYSRIEYQSYTEPTPIACDEGSKIRYLIGLMSSFPGKFIRNGREYSPYLARWWLRRKMHKKRYDKDPIDSADEFIERIATRSHTTGRNYQIEIPDQGRFYTSEILVTELNKIEEISNCES